MHFQIEQGETNIDISRIHFKHDSPCRQGRFETPRRLALQRVQHDLIIPAQLRTTGLCRSEYALRLPPLSLQKVQASLPK